VAREHCCPSSQLGALQAGKHPKAVLNPKAGPGDVVTEIAASPVVGDVGCNQGKPAEVHPATSL
jgi:hypothetical protein